MVSNNELLLLKYISDEFKEINELAKESGLNEDFIRHSIEILKEQDLVKLDVKKVENIILDEFGKVYKDKLFPEETLNKVLSKPRSIQELQKELGKDANIYLGIGKKQGLIKIDNSIVSLNKKINTNEFEELRNALRSIDANKKIDKTILTKLQKMHKLVLINNTNLIYVKKTNKANNINFNDIKDEKIQLTSTMLKNNEWKNITFKKYDVEKDVELKQVGKYQPYKRFLDLIRKKITNMGFEEMPTTMIVPEFYNFDVLFQPQNHSARTWTDTYTLKVPKTTELKNKDLVKEIKNAHENGGISGSKGWGYRWNEDIAKRLMPVAHCTAFSAKKMTEGVKIPARYFAISRVYRPDVLDATHLNEFNQLEGFVVADNVSFSNLLDLLKKFAFEITGAKEIMFYPDYYPFTEPSVQLSAKHPILGWVELGGAGMFRPEITETLGIKQRVIAWGLGIDRLAMFNLGLNDIRDLFSNKLDWLREKPVVEKI